MVKKSTRSTKQASPLFPEYMQDNNISYQPALIPSLKSQHTSILANLQAVETCALNGNYGETKEALEEFRKELQAHLHEENLCLYDYLVQSLRDTRDDNRRQAANEMHIEMGLIGRTVVEFLNHYREHPVGDANIDMFRIELGCIYRALHERMSREEKQLFSLYLPSD
jgi:regulator of sigma D